MSWTISKETCPQLYQKVCENVEKNYLNSHSFYSWKLINKKIKFEFQERNNDFFIQRINSGEKLRFLFNNKVVVELGENEVSFYSNVIELEIRDVMCLLNSINVYCKFN